MVRTPFPLWTVLAPLALTLLWLGAVAWYESRVDEVGVRAHLIAAAVGSAIVFGAAYLLQVEFVDYPGD